MTTKTTGPQGIQKQSKIKSVVSKTKTFTKNQDEYDHVIIDCGYTHRLVDKIPQIQKFFYCIKLDYLYVGRIYLEPSESELHRINPEVNQDEAYQLVDLGKRHGHLCFSPRSQDYKINYGTALDLAVKLMQLEHCGCFDFNNLMSTTTATIGEKSVLVLHFDTESG